MYCGLGWFNKRPREARRWGNGTPISLHCNSKRKNPIIRSAGWDDGFLIMVEGDRIAAGLKLEAAAEGEAEQVGLGAFEFGIQHAIVGLAFFNGAVFDQQ